MSGMRRLPPVCSVSIKPIGRRLGGGSEAAGAIRDHGLNDNARPFFDPNGGIKETMSSVQRAGGRLSQNCA